MPDPNRPRRLPPDPNPEDDSPAPRPAPRPVAKPPAPPAAARPAPKAPPKPAFEVVDDTEVEASAKGKTAEVRKPARAARDEDDDDRPRKKKPKKKAGKAKTAAEYDEELRERRLKEFEYIWPGVLLVVGMGMSLTGAIGSAGAGGFLSVLVIVLGLLVSIPLTIVTLMVVGMLVGINYGRFGPAVLKIAAVTFIVNGVYFLGDWFKLPLFIVGPVAGAVSFGLFKAIFDLDNQETGTSIGALNVMSFLLKMAILLVLAIVTARHDRTNDRNPGPDDDDPVPSDTRRDRGKGMAQPPPVLMPGDDPGDPDDDP